MDLGLNGKVVIVTGGSRGIGSGISEVFAKEGAKLVVNYHSNEKSAFEFCESLKAQYGCDAFPVKGNVGDENDVKGIFDAAYEQFGGIDILINNAGRGFTKMVWEMDIKDWNLSLNDNLTGQFLMSREFARRLMPLKKRGWIVNILSKASMSSTTKGRSAYVSNKAGELGLTRALAVDLTEYGIHVNGIMPGFVMASTMQKKLKEDPGDYERRVERVPIKRPGEPWEIGSMAAFLASDQCQLAVGSVVDMTGGLLLGY